MILKTERRSLLLCILVVCASGLDTETSYPKFLMASLNPSTETPEHYQNEPGPYL
jgi:hypothetical protein